MLIMFTFKVLWKSISWASRKTKMSNCIFFSGTNCGGGDCGGTFTTSIFQVLPLLTKLWAHCKNLKILLCEITAAGITVATFVTKIQI